MRPFLVKIPPPAQRCATHLVPCLLAGHFFCRICRIFCAYCLRS